MKKKNYLVYYSGENGKHQEQTFYNYQISIAYTQHTNGHLLIIVN